MSRRIGRAIAAAMLAFAGLSLTSLACAHRLDEWLQATTVRIEPGHLSLGIRIAFGAALGAASIAEIDSDADGRFSATEQTAYAEAVRRHLAVSIDGRSWASRATVVSFPEPQQIRAGVGDVLLRFEGPVALAAGAHRLRIDSVGHRSGAVYLVNALQPVDASLHSLVQKRSADQSSYELDFEVDAARPTSTVPCPAVTRTAHAAPTAAVLETFFAHGLQHILHGYDHLLFAVALALAVDSFKELLLVMTSFTLAHSLTLTMVVFGLARAPASVVEPAISASIVFVAMQNVWWPTRARGWPRLAATFCFGLFHGLGFAGGLIGVIQEMPGGVVTAALVGFTLGIEAGQQIVVAPMFAMSTWLHRRHGNNTARGAISKRDIHRLGSAAIALAGVWYLFDALAPAR